MSIVNELYIKYKYWSPFDLRFKSDQVSQEDGNADQAEQPDLVLLSCHDAD